jgi:GTPase involved in cell partitioning and DNA repair
MRSRQPAYYVDLNDSETREEIKSFDPALNKAIRVLIRNKNDTEEVAFKATATAEGNGEKRILQIVIIKNDGKNLTTIKESLSDILERISRVKNP